MSRASTPWEEIRAQLLANPKVKAAYEALGRKHMRIALGLIKDSPRPIRTSWDEDALNELAKSIAEQGVIVPIKVRPVEGLPGECLWHGYRAITGEDAPPSERGGDDELIGECHICDKIVAWIWPARVDEDGDEWSPYDRMCEEPPDNPPFEIVYGHRRVEAARRACLTEIDAVVEGVDDTAALVQALIENVQREDMTSLDVAKALSALRDSTGWTLRQIADQFGWSSERNVGNYLAMLNPPILSVLGAHHGAVSVAAVREARAGTPDDHLAADVLDKTGREGLSPTQTRAVAETVAKTADPERRRRLLETPYNPFTHNPEYAEMNERADRITAPTAQERFDSTPEVAIVLEQIKKLREAMRLSAEAVEMGKASPEARRFIGRRMIDLGQELIKRGEALSS